MATTDIERLKWALESVPVETFALQGTKEVAEVVQRVGELNLAMRAGGGKYIRSVARLFTAPKNDGWAAVFQSPFMGMEWGGWVTNVFGNKIGSERSKAIGLKPMWAPWHRDYEQGYIIGSAWSSLGSGEATEKQADQVLRAYTKRFDEAGLRRGR